MASARVRNGDGGQFTCQLISRAAKWVNPVVHAKQAEERLPYDLSEGAWPWYSVAHHKAGHSKPILWGPALAKDKGHLARCLIHRSGPHRQPRPKTRHHRHLQHRLVHCSRPRPWPRCCRHTRRRPRPSQMLVP